MTNSDQTGVKIAISHGRLSPEQAERIAGHIAKGGNVPLSYHPTWLSVLADGLGHVPYCLEAVQGERRAGSCPWRSFKAPCSASILLACPT